MFKTILAIFSSLIPNKTTKYPADKKESNLKKNILITLICVVFLWHYKGLVNDRDDLTILTDKLTLSVSSLEEQIEKINYKEEVESSILVQREIREDNIQMELDVLKNKLDTDINKLKVIYKDEKDTTAYELASSDLIINGMWGHYCNGISDNLRCSQ